MIQRSPEYAALLPGYTLIARQLGERLGQPVIADNSAGAAGTVNAEITAQAAPDGYMLLVK